MTELFQVIYEDTDLLVVNKPADLVCHPTKTDEYSSLISRARLYLGEGSHPQLVNRLDRETSGVTVIAKTAEAARELRHVWESRQVEKNYFAIVHGHPANDHGLIEAPIGKDVSSKVAIKDHVCPDAAPAQTAYSVDHRFVRKIAGSDEGPQPFALLSVRPQTGRKHQIRIHLAHVGHPIVGDKLYGGDEQIYLDFVQHRLTAVQKQRLIFKNQALHASRVAFEWRRTPREYIAKPESWFLEFHGPKFGTNYSLPSSPDSLR